MTISFERLTDGDVRVIQNGRERIVGDRNPDINVLGDGKTIVVTPHDGDPLSFTTDETITITGFSTPGTAVLVAESLASNIFYPTAAATSNANGQATMANSAPVVIASNQSAVPVSLASLPALVAGAAAIGTVGINAALPAGANLLGSVNLASSAGLGFGTYHTLISLNTVNNTLVKSSNGCLGMIHAFNFAAYIIYLKFYNKSSTPAVGTDTPVFVFPIPAGGSILIAPAIGIRLFTGIAYGLTKDLANNGTTAVLANDVVVNIAYT